MHNHTGGSTFPVACKGPVAGLEGDGRESSLAGSGQHPRFSKCFVVLLTAGLRGDGRESSVAGCGLTFMLGHADCFYLLDSPQAGKASLPNYPEKAI